MNPDNPKGISKLRFRAKVRRVNGINDLPVFMHQRRAAQLFSADAIDVKLDRGYAVHADGDRFFKLERQVIPR